MPPSGTPKPDFSKATLRDRTKLLGGDFGPLALQGTSTPSWEGRKKHRVTLFIIFIIWGQTQWILKQESTKGTNLTWNSQIKIRCSQTYMAATQEASLGCAGPSFWVCSWSEPPWMVQGVKILGPQLWEQGPRDYEEDRPVSLVQQETRTCLTGGRPLSRMQQNHWGKPWPNSRQLVPLSAGHCWSRCRLEWNWSFQRPQEGGGGDPRFSSCSIGLQWEDEKLQWGKRGADKQGSGPPPPVWPEQPCFSLLRIRLL